MALSHVSKLFAVTDAKVYAVTADPSGGATTYGAAIDVPGIKSVTISGNIDTKELRGDNTLLDTNSVLTNITVDFEYAKLNLDAVAAMIGGAVTDSGSTPNAVATYRLTNTNTFSYFKLEAKTPTAGSDSVTGDAHIVLYKCMLSSFPELGMAEEDYQTFKASAVAVGRASDGRWIDVVFNETAAALSA